MVSNIYRVDYNGLFILMPLASLEGQVGAKLAKAASSHPQLRYGGDKPDAQLGQVGRLGANLICDVPGHDQYLIGTVIEKGLRGQDREFAAGQEAALF
jgi:hypothetical protein